MTSLNVLGDTQCGTLWWSEMLQIDRTLLHCVLQVTSCWSGTVWLSRGTYDCEETWCFLHYLQFLDDSRGLLTDGTPDRSLHETWVMMVNRKECFTSLLETREKSCGKLLSKRNWGSYQIPWVVKRGGNQPPILGAELNLSPRWLLFTICATSRSYPVRSKKTHCCHPAIITIHTVSLLITTCVRLMTGSMKLEIWKKPS